MHTRDVGQGSEYVVLVTGVQALPAVSFSLVKVNDSAAYEVVWGGHWWGQAGRQLPPTFLIGMDGCGQVLQHNCSLS